jgi:uncharacterized protein YwgA
MNRFKQDALLAETALKLRVAGSWCGETHMQKAVYFLQCLRRVPLGFTFMLYKHGPFSFDLRDELTAMVADGFLEVHAQWPYGPSLLPTGVSEELRKSFPKTLHRYDSDIRFVSNALGDRNVSELEKLATALYVYSVHAGDSQRKQARILHELKPHIAVPDALEAVKQVDCLAQASA